jgi:F-type H+-transporting ATPase subunit epsilon
MKVKIVTPRKIEFEGEAENIVLPTLQGEIAVLPRHAALISVLKPGRIKMTLRRGSGQEKEEATIQIEGGVLQVLENSATILLKNFNIS